MSLAIDKKVILTLAFLARPRLNVCQIHAMLAEHIQKRDRVIGVIDGGLEVRFAYATEIAELFLKRREIVREILNIWLDWWHDLMLVKTQNSEDISNVDRAEELKGMASGFILGQIREFIGYIQRAEEQLRQNVNPRLVFEVLILNMPERRNG